MCRIEDLDNLIKPLAISSSSFMIQKICVNKKINMYSGLVEFSYHPHGSLNAF